MCCACFATGCQCGVNMASSLTPRAHAVHPAVYHPYRFIQRSPTVANRNQGELFTVMEEIQSSIIKRCYAIERFATFYMLHLGMLVLGLGCGLDVSLLKDSMKGFGLDRDAEILVLTSRICPCQRPCSIGCVLVKKLPTLVYMYQH